MKILTTILMTVLPKLLSMLTPDVVREGLDAFLDVVEDKALSSENTIDDAIVLPVCNVIRVALNVPDDDDPSLGP